MNSFTFSQLSNKIHQKNYSSSKSKNKEKIIKNKSQIKNNSSLIQSLLNNQNQ